MQISVTKTGLATETLTSSQISWPRMFMHETCREIARLLFLSNDKF